MRQFGCWRKTPQMVRSTVLKRKGFNAEAGGGGGHYLRNGLEWQLRCEGRVEGTVVDGLSITG